MIQKSHKWQVIQQIILWQALASSVLLYSYPKAIEKFIAVFQQAMMMGYDSTSAGYRIAFMAMMAVILGVLFINMGVGVVAPLTLLKRHYLQKGNIALRYAKLYPAWYLVALIAMIPIPGSIIGLGTLVMTLRWMWWIIFGIVILLSGLFIWNEGKRNKAQITPDRILYAKRIRIVIIHIERLIWSFFVLPQTIILLLLFIYPSFFGYYIWAIFATVLGWDMPI